MKFDSLAAVQRARQMKQAEAQASENLKLKREISKKDNYILWGSIILTPFTIGLSWLFGFVYLLYSFFSAKKVFVKNIATGEKFFISKDDWRNYKLIQKDNKNSVVSLYDKDNSFMKESSLSDGQQKIIDNVNNFPEFLESYVNLDASERTPVWDEEIYGKNVTWTGTIFEVGEQQIYVIDSSKYQEGMDWVTVSTTPDAYSVFVADFETDINDENFPIGNEITVNGDLESRGDPNLNYHWKLYNAELN